MHSEITQIGIISLGWKSIAEIMQFIAGSFAQICSDMWGYYPYEWQNSLKSQKKKKKREKLQHFVSYSSNSVLIFSLLNPYIKVHFWIPGNVFQDSTSDQKGSRSRLGIFFKHLHFKVIFEAETGDCRELVLVEHVKKLIKQVIKCKKTEFC